LLAIATFVCAPAVGEPLSLYEQEGTAADGYGTIDASGQGGDHASTTNWKYQYGSGTWSGVYGDSGWIEIDSDGDSVIDIECDIEMYYKESFENNKVYFHLGNIYTATKADKTAYVDGNFTSNNGMYLGICFAAPEHHKTEEDMLKDNEGNYTGEIAGAMVGTIDVLGRDISTEAFNVKILMSWDDGENFYPPVSFGTGASGTITDTLWWLVSDGDPGEFPVKWSIELQPDTHQPDGNYHFDPTVVAAPVL